MNKILDKYSTRLINISGKNRSLVLRRLYKKRSFDLVTLDEFSEGLSTRVIEFILSRDKTPLTIINDPYLWFNNEEKKLKKQLKSFEAYDDNGSLIDINTQEEKLRKKQERLISYSTSLRALSREINSTFKETGRYELFLGYPFVEGYFKDKTFVKAPLFLFPVEVIKTGDKWALKNKVDSPILLNKVFLIAYAKFNEEKQGKLNTEFDNLSEFSANDSDVIFNALKYLKSNNIQISYESKAIETFKIIPKDTALNYRAGELQIKKNIILGHFNIANSIYNDYKELEDIDITSSMITSLLKVDENKSIEAIDDEKYEKVKDISEKDYYFISNLDYSQEIAVKKADKKNSLVIYGPPGTGKSQTIVNIVSQYISQGKKVLMVSQKKAALDVIYNRSASINSKMIMFNKDVDKKEFYSRVSWRISSLTKSTINTRDINKHADNIDTDIANLNKLCRVLTDKRDNGLSLNEMYSMEKLEINPQSKLDNFFREYRRELPFNDKTYGDLKDNITSINNKDVLEKYYSLKELCGDNEYVNYLKESLDTYDKDDCIYEVDFLIDNLSSEINKLSEAVKYFDDIKDIIIKDNETLKAKADEITKREHGDLLLSLNTASKFSLSYWLNRKKNTLKEQENKQLYNEKLEATIVQLNSDKATIEVLLKRFDVLSYAFNKDEVLKFMANFYKVDLVLKKLTMVKQVLENYETINVLKLSLDTLTSYEKKIVDYVYSKVSNYEDGKDILNKIPNLSVQITIAKLEREYSKELHQINDFEKIKTRVATSMEVKRNLVPKYINDKWDNIALGKKSLDIKMWSNMEREANKKSRLLHIREFVRIYSDIIFDLFPCWLLSPESVSEILPLTEGLFDVIIFDEASQMFIESAIPTVYRGKKIIVAGDDKQLKPSSTFSGRYEDEEEDDYDLDNVAALEEESLLDLAKFSFDGTSLYYHYRSKYDELINFSNYAFYNGKLEVSPNTSKVNDKKLKPIERIKVDGRWIDRVNKEEAIKVVSLIKDILLNRKHEETVGVITFNITQRDLIEELLEIEAGKDPEFAEKYFAEEARNENNEDLSLFVKNIENVQGDERDIIIFSTAYAKNENGRVTANFGSLSSDGGENRLNVAISRAKEKIYLVTSIEPEELKVDGTKNNGPKLLKKYLQYVREVSEGNMIAAKEILYSLLDSSLDRSQTDHYDSDFENQVHDALKKAGLKVDTQIGVSGYKIDLAIYDEKTSKYILGIECDGAAYHSSKSARERDIYRQRYLESRGWKITRIWSKDWWTNPQGEIDKIINKVKN